MCWIPQGADLGLYTPALAQPTHFLLQSCTFNSKSYSHITIWLSSF